MKINTNQYNNYSKNELNHKTQNTLSQNSILSNNINNLKTNNFEKSILTKGNLIQEENKSDKNSINSNQQNGNYYKEKLKTEEKIFNEIHNINSETNLADNIIIKKPLQEYLQNGYKKYLHAKNNRELIQHYDFWEGANYFPYGGRILEGPCAFRPTLAAGLAVTLPTALFIGFNAEYITINWTIAILIFAGILCLIVLIFLILSSFTDPGILRRYHYNYFYKIERKSTKVFQLGFLRHYKYCGTCSIMRPIRSSHCFDCNNCVERCDHHCPWIGNCVGKRNYVFFYLFVLTFSFMILYLEIFCIAHISKYLYNNIQDYEYEVKTKKKNHIVAYSLCDVIISLYLIIYGVVCLAFSLGLFLYHTYLITNNTTTKEVLKFIWKNPFGNPYNRNCEYNSNNSLFPEVKKYSILDILRNGKRTNDSEGKEKHFNKLYQYNIYNNDNLINNYNEQSSNNQNKEKRNIDPNQDIKVIIEQKNNNNYTDIDDTTLNNIL